MDSIPIPKDSSINISSNPHVQPNYSNLLHQTKFNRIDNYSIYPYTHPYLYPGP